LEWIRGTVAGLVAWGLLACSQGSPLVEISEPEFGAGTAHFALHVPPTAKPASVEIRLDGRTLKEGRGLRLHDDGRYFELTVSSGAHVVTAKVEFDAPSLRTRRSHTRHFVAPDGAPRFRAARPRHGRIDVPTGSWVELVFAGRVDADVLRTLELACDEMTLERVVHRVARGRIAIDPKGRLPHGALCRVAWRGQRGPRNISFTTVSDGPAAQVVYERRRGRVTIPFPDDYWTRPDPRSPTGLRVRLPRPRDEATARIVDALRADVDGLDGWSPIAHLVVEFDQPVAPRSLPRTPSDSLDPLASVALLDLDPTSPYYGSRIPFRSELHNGERVGELVSHTLLIFPSIPLSPGGRYGLVLSSRVVGVNGRSLAPSPVMEAALSKRTRTGGGGVARVRALIAPVLAASEQRLFPPIGREDMALALRFTVRSLEELPDDMLAVREQIFAASAPHVRIDRIEASLQADSPLAAVIYGHWSAPNWMEESNWARDEEGRPRRTGERDVPFALALPRQAETGPVPVVIYQHGNPGSAEQEVPSPARDHLLRAGFAVVGFTDLLNRELAVGTDDPHIAVAKQVLHLLVATLIGGRVPDYWAQTHAEQLAFIRALEPLGTLDFLPVGKPDGVAELDLSAPLGYVGVSEGANLGPAMLAWAPEIRVAALVSGGARLTEMMIHQQSDTLLEDLPLFFRGVRPADVWSGLALFQTAFDRQDGHIHARFIHRDPIPVAGTTRRASVLLIAGLGDGLVPNHATDSLAWQLGNLPVLGSLARRAPFLRPARGPLRANLGPETTGGYLRLAPMGLRGVTPTRGCMPPAVDALSSVEGHFCAQLAEESRLGRANFLISAQTSGAPVIEVPDAKRRSSRSP
jgi:hypothetical protein